MKSSIWQVQQAVSALGKAVDSAVPGPDLAPILVCFGAALPAMLRACPALLSAELRSPSLRSPPEPPFAAVVLVAPTAAASAAAAVAVATVFTLTTAAANNGTVWECYCNQ